MAGESEGGSTSWGNNYGRPTQYSPSGERVWSDELGSVTTNDNGNISWNGNNGSGGFSDVSSTNGNWNNNAYSFLNSLFGKQFGQEVNTLNDVGDQLKTLPNINYNSGEGTDAERASYLTGLAEQAKTGRGAFATMLGREPTRAELQQLSEKGYDSMYGVNPNNMEGQSVGNMLAAQKTGDFIGNVGNAAISAAMPAPMSLAINGTRAWQEYQKTGDWKQALGNVLGGLGGYAGAAGQAMKGDYGNAVTAALNKGGASPLVSLFGGTGVDYARGKDVSQNLGGIAGYTLGNAAGKGYGGLGQTLGRSFLSSIFRK
jgi:hypothetical protein